MQYETSPEFPIHVQFKDMIVKAQNHADKIKKPVPVSWRGYKTKINPDLPKFNKYDLDTLLDDAVDHILQREKEEVTRNVNEEDDDEAREDGDDDDDDDEEMGRKKSISKLSRKNLKILNVR